MSIGKRIRHLREEKNMTQEDLAKKIGVATQTIFKYEKEIVTNIPLGKLQLIAFALNTTLAYLMGYNAPIYEQNIPEIPNLQKYNPIVYKIPILGYISAGLPLYAEEHIEGYTYTERNGGAEYFALKVKGDSMSAAQINDGNIVIVRRQEIVENGEIAVVMVGNSEAIVKRFKQDGKIIQLIPQSYNPKHEIQIYNLDKINVTVIGKIVECKINF